MKQDFDCVEKTIDVAAIQETFSELEKNNGDMIQNLQMNQTSIMNKLLIEVAEREKRKCSLILFDRAEDIRRYSQG